MKIFDTITQPLSWMGKQVIIKIWFEDGSSDTLYFNKEDFVHLFNFSLITRAVFGLLHYYKDNIEMKNYSISKLYYSSVISWNINDWYEKDKKILMAYYPELKCDEVEIMSKEKFEKIELLK